ncbi:hypothetical protein SVIO_103280 [Streptomyces violaceusniger]|uniref:Epoxide hydrolase N-terminal domain-containing protein n=1 Tax=Streptomyces violaceusniger TaxID=68280 RepID=A0A4D4LFD5_STRVO|nr:hypothetical protein SVIO_103280 [Streptomyces violaceusniger]
MTAAPQPTEPEPYTIHIPQEVLDDLRTRLRATRFASDPGNESEIYGLPTAYLRPLVSYWADGFDWRAVEKELNTYTHHRVDVGEPRCTSCVNRAEGRLPSRFCSCTAGPGRSGTGAR